MRSHSFKTRALDAALRLIETSGAERVKLSDIAVELETGPASIYYHFKSKDALLAEVAVAGFKDLEAALQHAHDTGDGDGALRACGAYLHFIRDRTLLYKLMYSQQILECHPEARRAEARAFDRFAGLVTMRSSLGEGCDSRALALWALGRGIAALAITADADEPGAGRQLAGRAIDGLEVLMGRPIRSHPR